MQSLSRDLVVHRPHLRWMSYEPSNVSWWLAWSFTIGSILWVVDGYYLLWPLGDAKENLILTSHIAVLGGFVFLVGAYFGVLEAIYAEREGNFEIASEWVLISTSTLLGSVIHHIQLGSLDEGPNKMVSTVSTKPEWKWWSLELDTIAKKAGMTQFAGAVVFFISVVCSLAKRDGTDILIPAEQWILQDVTIWGLQIIGSLCFLYAAFAFYLELQNQSYCPKIHLLEWHVQLWNILGAGGFLICAIFGLFTNYKGVEYCCETAMEQSSFLGSIAFLVSSVLMVVEIANKHPNAAD